MFLPPIHTADHLTHCQRFCLHFRHRCRFCTKHVSRFTPSYTGLQGTAPCDLETISYPRTVLIKGRVDRCGPQLVPGSGEGQNTRNKSTVGAEADRQSTAKVAGSRRHSVSRALFAQGCSCPLKRRRLVLVPVWFQLGVRLIRLPLISRTSAYRMAPGSSA